MFIPLSLATLGSLPLNKVASGAGFYNLTRQMGSSIGIAIVTVMLSHQEAIHRAALVQHISAGGTAAMDRVTMLTGAFSRHSADPVGTVQQSYKVLDQIVNGQAMLLSFADIFFYVAVAFTASLPLILLLSKGKGGAPAPSH